MIPPSAKPASRTLRAGRVFAPMDGMRPIPMLHRPLLATLLGLALVAAPGCAKKRIKGDYAAPSQSSGETARAAGLIKEVVLPPPTMSAREIRHAFWDMAARQRRNEGGKALADYTERASSARTLESRFLAAAAIPDLEAQWDAVYLVAKEQPKFYWAHAQMAAIYAAWKVRDQCIKELERAEEAMPGVSYTLTIRGHFHRNVGELAEAIQSYDAALKIDPSDADARAGAALARRAATGQLGTLEAELKRASADVPTHYESAEALAVLFDEQERNAEAKGAWTKVAELMPKNRSARLALARLAGDQDPAGAVAAYEQAAKIQPLTKSEQQALAKLYQVVGRTDDEIKSLQVISKLDPKDLAPWRRLAAIYEGKKDLANMESTYNSIRAIDGKDRQALMGLARVAEKRAQLRNATELYKQALAAGEAAADGDIKRLRVSYMIPAKPLTATSLANFYRASLDSLEGMYNERLKGAPALKGSLRAKIVNDGEGHATSVDIVENTTGDPYLDAHLYYVMLEGAWPKLKPNERKSFTLKFDLPPQKQ